MESRKERNHAESQDRCFLTLEQMNYVHCNENPKGTKENKRKNKRIPRFKAYINFPAGLTQ